MVTNTGQLCVIFKRSDISLSEFWSSNHKDKKNTVKNIVLMWSLNFNQSLKTYVSWTLLFRKTVACKKKIIIIIRAII